MAESNVLVRDKSNPAGGVYRLVGYFNHAGLRSALVKDCRTGKCREVHPAERLEPLLHQRVQGIGEDKV